MNFIKNEFRTRLISPNINACLALAQNSHSRIWKDLGFFFLSKNCSRNIYLFFTSFLKDLNFMYINKVVQEMS